MGKREGLRVVGWIGLRMERGRFKGGRKRGKGRVRKEGRGKHGKGWEKRCYQNVFLENKIHSLFNMIDTKCM